MSKSFWNEDDRAFHECGRVPLRKTATLPSYEGLSLRFSFVINYTVIALHMSYRYAYVFSLEIYGTMGAPRSSKTITFAITITNDL